MSGINIQLLAAEMQRHVVQNKNVVKADFARATTVSIDKYCKKVTKIQGSYQVLHSIMTHVVQGFAPVWQELGEFAVKDKELKNYHQKINFPFVPAHVLGTFLAEWYEEEKKPTDKEIAKRIVDWILTQVTDDVEYLSMHGDFVSGAASGQFGFSINGFNTLVADLLENTVNPCFKIPLEPITKNNVLEQIRKFENGLPKLFSKKIQQIHLSDNVADLYANAYFDKYGHYPTFGMGDVLRTPLKKRELVAHEGMDDTVMFATIDGIMLNLIDINVPNTITDVQVQDYKVKVFGEFWKGWDFLINEAVCVADFVGNVRGLGDDELMELYYPHEVALGEPVIVPATVTVDPATATTSKDSTVQFTAVVGPDGAEQDVNWSVDVAEGLSVDSSGLVTVGASTPAGVYTVKATSVEKNTVSGTATLTVTE